MSSEKLGAFLAEVANWSWEEFAKAEKNNAYTSNQSIIFALIRACAMQQMSAIRVSLNRLDGKLKTPVRIELPKVFFLYPNAKLPQSTEPIFEKISDGGIAKITDDPTTTNDVTIVTGELMPHAEPEAKTEADLPSMSLRETLTEMGEYPRELPEQIVALALQTEQWIRKQAPEPPEIPRVKSVVAAHLLIMAQARNMDALTEVFDQIDGKLVETIQLLGEDIYITSYALEAPEGAYLNENGVLQAEAPEAQQMWDARLGSAK